MTLVSALTEVTDYLLLATSLAVRGIPLNVSLQEDVMLPVSGPAATFSGSAVEYDASEEAIFYNDRGRRLVYQSRRNGTGEVARCSAHQTAAVVVVDAPFVYQGLGGSSRWQLMASIYSQDFCIQSLDLYCYCALPTRTHTLFHALWTNVHIVSRFGPKWLLNALNVNICVNACNGGGLSSPFQWR